MGKKNRQHRPPQQSRIAPGGAHIIDPNRKKAEQQQQQQIIETRIQSLVAGFYTENVDLDIADDDEFEAAAQQTLERSFDAAVIFARQVWGLDLHRNPPQAEQQKAAEDRQSSPPQPIIEE
jgi:hypothetical protein